MSIECRSDLVEQQVLAAAAKAKNVLGVSENLDMLLTRPQTGAALRAAGFPVADKTLATKAVRGGGPPYRYWGSKAVLYRWGDVLDWAHSKLLPSNKGSPNA